MRSLRLATEVTKGLATYVPGIWRVFPRKGTGGTNHAPYCYTVWLKHLTMLYASGYTGDVPARIAEIGPGDSLGVGLIALLTGAREYHALDVVQYAHSERTQTMLDELVALLRKRAPRAAKGWPDFDVYLDDKLFPSRILSERALEECLRADRLAAVRAAAINPGQTADGILLTYAVPWTEPSTVGNAAVDLALSQSVLEHVVDLTRTYEALAQWLRPGGWMSHQIDFSAHGICEPWNGHRAYGEPLWKLIVGRRPFLINRQPPSVHIDLMRRCGFEVVTWKTNIGPAGLERRQLAPRWRKFTDEDLQTMSAFIQARKPT